MSRFLFFLSILFLIPSLGHSVDRITDAKIDRKKPFPIYIQAGRVTTIDMPCSISYALPGSHGDVQTEIGPDKDSTLIVWLTSARSSATSVTVRCSNRIVVFDIIPSRSNHQDYINVTSFESSTTKRELIDSSSAQKRKNTGGKSK